MEYKDWYGYKRIDFQFEDRQAFIVFPNHEGWGSGHWMCKMEYADAFPELEIDLLENGFHRAYMENKNRWGTDVDHDARVRFADYLEKEFGLSHKFVPIGMSCGGLHSVNFASRYPERVSVLHLDAPVMNLLSCPLGLGVGEALAGDGGWKEIVDVYNFTKSSILTYREHPMDRIPTLIAHQIPVALVYGDSDVTVPYIENGKRLEDAYRKAGVPLFCEGKAGCGHHPHGLENRGNLLEFIRRHI